MKSRNHIQQCPLTFQRPCGFGQLTEPKAKAKLLPTWRVDLVGTLERRENFLALMRNVCCSGSRLVSYWQAKKMSRMNT